MYAASTRFGQRAFPWLTLVCILVTYGVTVVRLHPTNFFGLTEDDAIYFSSARAIAEGKGYVLPSIPGTPRATKYPVLYPWVLSWVWRWNPRFPANLTDAVGLTVFFGLVFLTLIFGFLRRLGGINDAEALLITGFCALHPVVVFYGANIVAEIPFAALAIGAMFAADSATRPAASDKSALLCGMLAGLSTELRMIGAAVVAGIAATALLRRAWRQCVLLCASSSAFVLPLVWRALVYRQVTPRFDATNVGRTWAYYTSYPAVYHATVPDLHIFFAMLKASVGTLLRTPSDYLLFPWLKADTLVTLAAAVVLTGVIVAGVFRQARQHGWKPVHFVLAFYTLAALLWTFNELYRFFIPFLPLFVAGYWSEMKHLFEQVRETVAKSRAVTDMVVAAAFVVAISGATGAIAWNYVGPGRNMVFAIERDRAALAPAKHEAYNWMSSSTAQNSRVIAYEDASLYLYAGRQAMRPVIFTAAEFFEPERLKMALDHILDVAQTVGAQYWLVSDDDFGHEWAAASQGAIRRIQDLERSWPVVFRSSDGRVRIYSLDCVQRRDEGACKTVNSMDKSTL